MSHPTITHEATRLLSLAAPLSLVFLGQIAIGTTDTIMIGRLGYQTLAGVALSMNIYLLLLMIAIGLTVAATPLLARAAAVDDHNQLRHCIQHSVLMALLAGTLLSQLLHFVGPILLILGQEPALVTIGNEYMGYMMWSLPPAIVMISLRNFFSSLHQPLPVLFIIIGAILLNILLNYMLIFGHWGAPELGVKGAGIASVLVNLFMVLGLLLIAMTRKSFKQYKLFSTFTFDPKLLIKLSKIGLPISLSFLLEEGLFSASILLMGFINSESVAAHQIAMQISAITYMFTLGVGNAATVRVGNAMGRHDSQGVRASGLSAIVLAGTLMGLLSIIIWNSPDLITAIFLDTDDPANANVIELAATFLAIMAFYQIMDGIQLTAVGALYGFPDTRVPMIMAAISFWLVGVGTASLLAFVAGWEGVGIWIGLAAGLTLMALLSSWRFWKLSSQCERYFDKPRDTPIM